MDFYEYLLNRSRETAEKVFCSPSKMPLIIDQSQRSACVENTKYDI